MRFDIPENIQTVLECLRRAGFRAVPVGGCVRDLLLGNTPHDWDITTSATPTEMLAVFSGFRMLKIGQGAAKHGTITVVIDHTPIEVTTFRQDGTYSDSRRPDSVCFSRAIETDLARRDFTINAMCLGEDDSIIDLFGGQQDLQKGIIRAIGAPERRFGEDALRILRALRFAAVLGFVIEPQTAGSMLQHTGQLAALSAERIRAELEKLLCAPDCARVLMEYHEIIFAVFPELKPTLGLEQRKDYHCYDVYAHTAHAVGFAPPESVLKVALLLHDIGKPLCADGHGHFYGHAAQSAKLAEVVLRRLKFGNTAREQILFLVQRHDLSLCDADKIKIKKLLSKYGFAAMRRLLLVQKADIMAQRPDMRQERLAGLERVECLMQSIAAQRLPLNRSELVVSGRDIIAAGVSQGPQLGVLLDLLLQKVLDETLPNEAEALLEYVRLNRPDEI
ncbi:CCA tRNA nucleotidyltransferase [Oscillospiraceae bacterium LTW-04]|nr:HD domain-containing protein [Oscillospiraceae bacterium MB24-C1]